MPVMKKTQNKQTEEQVKHILLNFDYCKITDYLIIVSSNQR